MGSFSRSIDRSSSCYFARLFDWKAWLMSFARAGKCWSPEAVPFRELNEEKVSESFE